MEWLRCNKCYSLMTKIASNFIMTQCGHVFCAPCLSKAPTKCHVCDTMNFRSISLTMPPKLETMVNYFSPAMDFLQQTQKAMNFHDEQMKIALRGAKEIMLRLTVSDTSANGFQQKKYEHGKLLYAELRKKLEKQILHCNSLQEESKQLTIALEAYENENRNFPMEIDISESSQNHPRFSHERQSHSSNAGTSSTRQIERPAYSQTFQGQRQPSERSSIRSNWQSPLQSVPEYPYNPNPAFSNASRTSTQLTSDSGFESRKTETPGTIRQGDFLVPRTQRVPKSAALIRKKAQASERLSIPKTESDL